MGEPALVLSTTMATEPVGVALVWFVGRTVIVMTSLAPASGALVAAESDVVVGSSAFCANTTEELSKAKVEIKTAQSRRLGRKQFFIGLRRL